MKNIISALVGTSFTCQPVGRPVQTITILDVIIGEPPVGSNKTTGLWADCQIVTATKRGPVAQNSRLGLVTIMERLEYQVDAAPVVAPVKEVAPAAAETTEEVAEVAEVAPKQKKQKKAKPVVTELTEDEVANLAAEVGEQ